MTEQEARKKWCPFARPEFGNRPNQHPDLKCIASDCMAWRWYSYKHNPPLVSDPDEPTDGYCGLAGKP